MRFHTAQFATAALLAGASCAAHAGLVSSYRADNPDNSLNGSGDGTIDDLENVTTLGGDKLTVNAVTSAYDFTSSWSALTGRGIGGNGGEVNPFHNFGGTGTIELFIKADLTTESGTGNDELIFEAGAQGIGFTLGIIPNTSGADPQLRFFNNHVEAFLSLATLDGSDFIQIAAIIDESQGTSSSVILLARDASGTAVTSTTNMSGNNDIAGSDGIGVFSTDGNSGLGDSGGINGGFGAFDATFKGEVAAFKFYNDAESLQTLQDSYDAVIPEPGSLALLGLGGLLVARRRRG